MYYSKPFDKNIEEQNQLKQLKYYEDRNNETNIEEVCNVIDLFRIPKGTMTRDIDEFTGNSYNDLQYFSIKEEPIEESPPIL